MQVPCAFAIGIVLRPSLRIRMSARFWPGPGGIRIRDGLIGGRASGTSAPIVRCITGPIAVALIRPIVRRTAPRIVPAITPRIVPAIARPIVRCAAPRIVRCISRPIAAAFGNPIVRRADRRRSRIGPAAVGRFVGRAQLRVLTVAIPGLLSAQVAEPERIGWMDRRRGGYVAGHGRRQSR